MSTEQEPCCHPSVQITVGADGAHTGRCTRCGAEAAGASLDQALIGLSVPGATWAAHPSQPGLYVGHIFVE